MYTPGNGRLVLFEVRSLGEFCLIIATYICIRNGRLVLFEVRGLSVGGEVVRHHHHRIRAPVLELGGHVDRVAALLLM